jgi:hypothetical protein
MLSGMYNLHVTWRDMSQPSPLSLMSREVTYLWQPGDMPVFLMWFLQNHPEHARPSLHKPPIHESKKKNTISFFSSRLHIQINISLLAADHNQRSESESESKSVDYLAHPLLTSTIRMSSPQEVDPQLIAQADNHKNEGEQLILCPQRRNHF